MKPTLLTALGALLILPLIAEETPQAASDAVVAEPKKPSSEEIRKQLVEAANQARKELEKSDPDGPHHDALTIFMHALEKVSGNYDPRRRHDIFSMELPRQVEAFRKTRELTEEYSKQLGVEFDESIKAFEKKQIDAIQALLKQVIATDDPAKLSALGEKLVSQFNSATHEAPRGFEGQSRHDSFMRDSSAINQLVSNVARIHTHRSNEAWGEAASVLRDTGSSISRLRRYISREEANAFLTKTRESIGLLPPDKMQDLFNRTLADLLDDANQDRLDEIQSAIKTQRKLHNYDSENGFSRKWQSLESLASGFVRNVNSVKLGGASQFSPEQWLQSNSDGPKIISPDDLGRSLKNYRVRLKGKDGAVVEEPLCYDINEVLAGIKTPADIEREIPALNKAVRQLEYSSGSGNWPVFVNKLQQFAELHSKLDSGISFQIPVMQHPDYGGREYPRAMSGNDIAQAKADDLNQQLQWMMLQRLYPELVIDTKASPSGTVGKRFEEAKVKGDFSAMLTLNQLSGIFTPGQMLLTPQSSMVIQHYLNGVKQEEQLDQPRLATYYYQRAAAFPDGPVPVSELKQRLHGLKQRSPDHYEKGTDDSLKSGPEPHAGYYQASLNVPAKTTAAGKSPGIAE